jgi:hypothetical protein
MTTMERRRLSEGCRHRAGIAAGLSIWAEGEGEMIMKALLILVAICLSANAFAQDAPPKADNKPRAQVKPREPMGCKLVGTVRGTKLWAGDCEAAELRGSSAPATETPSLPERASAIIPPGQKQ